MGGLDPLLMRTAQHMAAGNAGAAMWRYWSSCITCADHRDAMPATILHCQKNSHAPPQCFWCMWKRQSGSRQSAPRPMRPLQQAGATALVRAHRCKLYAAVNGWANSTPPCWSCRDAADVTPQ